MAIAQPTGYPAPWYARLATAAGRPVVLAVTLLMCAPGEYHLARLAGWSREFAGGMPFAMSAYAGIAAVVAAHRPKGSRGRVSAILGAAAAIVLALAAQVVSHLITTGHMTANQPVLIAIVSAVPPAVVGHLLHLAATPVPTGIVTGPTPPPARESQPTEAVSSVLTPVTSAPAAFPPAPAQPPALPPVSYADPRLQLVRSLYQGGRRPETREIRDALTAAGYLGQGGAPLSDGWIRGARLNHIERNEPHLAA